MTGLVAGGCRGRKAVDTAREREIEAPQGDDDGPQKKPRRAKRPTRAEKGRRQETRGPAQRRVFREARGMGEGEPCAAESQESGELSKDAKRPKKTIRGEEKNRAVLRPKPGRIGHRAGGLCSVWRKSVSPVGSSGLKKKLRRFCQVWGQFPCSQGGHVTAKECQGKIEAGPGPGRPHFFRALVHGEGVPGPLFRAVG